MTNNRSGYRLADTSKEHNVLQYSEQVEYSTKTKKVMLNLPYKLRCVYKVENEKVNVTECQTFTQRRENSSVCTVFRIVG